MASLRGVFNHIVVGVRTFLDKTETNKTTKEFYKNLLDIPCLVVVIKII